MQSGYKIIQICNSIIRIKNVKQERIDKLKTNQRIKKLEMWANAQPDGRPAEYR